MTLNKTECFVRSETVNRLKVNGCKTVNKNTSHSLLTCQMMLLTCMNKQSGNLITGHGSGAFRT